MFYYVTDEANLKIYFDHKRISNISRRFWKGPSVFIKVFVPSFCRNEIFRNRIIRADSAHNIPYCVVRD